MMVEKGHHVKITASGYEGGGTKVEIDGIEVQQLVDVKFEHPVDGVATLMISILPQSVQVAGEIGKLLMLRTEER